MTVSSFRIETRHANVPRQTSLRLRMAESSPDCDQHATASSFVIVRRRRRCSSSLLLLLLLLLLNPVFQFEYCRMRITRIE